jgi:hypothetical protein
VDAPVGQLDRPPVVTGMPTDSGLGSPRPSAPPASDAADVAGLSGCALAMVVACLPLVNAAAQPSP